MIPQRLILYPKPLGVTSFESLYLWKKKLQTKKLGHTGTLDKFASGLLILLTGSMTRLTDEIHLLEKEYIAKMKLGEETDTLDTEGTVIRTAPVPTRSDLEKSIPGFLGVRQQKPPEYSAIKIDGKRASDRVRDGEDAIIKSREVRLDSMEILDHHKDSITFRIVCGSGYYVRSLARDWAAASGSAGYLTELIRTRIGPFSLKHAFEHDSQGFPMESWEAFQYLPGWDRLILDTEGVRDTGLGRIPQDVYRVRGDKAAVFNADHVWLGAFHRIEDTWSFICSVPVH